MPTISLRMTDEQHAELAEWAHQGHRSIQREIIWRLFTIEGNQAPKYWPATAGPLEAIEVPLGGLGHLPERATTPLGQRTVTSGEYSKEESAAKSSVAQEPAARSGSCPMSPARGTKCKVCGKVHPL